MAIDNETLAFVRGQLCGTLDRIERDLPRLSTHELIRRIEALRAEARPYGMTPLLRLARACEEAVAVAGRGAMVRLYLGSMRDAVGCEGKDDKADAEAGDAYLATIAVRMAG